MRSMEDSKQLGQTERLDQAKQKRLWMTVRQIAITYDIQEHMVRLYARRYGLLRMRLGGLKIDKEAWETFLARRVLGSR